MTQKFKGDAKELKMEAAGQPALDLCSNALDDFYDGCYSAADFLLALYDEGRMPFSDRVPRDAFVDFIGEAIPNFPFTGAFEAYIFMLRAIFGAGTEMQFDVPAPGKLEIIVNAAAAKEFNWIGREWAAGAFEEFGLVTSDGAELEFVSVPGIDTPEELSQLLAELIPAGIWPDITLTFFELSDFTAEDPAGSFYSVITHTGDTIVFFELEA